MLLQYGQLIVGAHEILFAESDRHRTLPGGRSNKGHKRVQRVVTKTGKGRRRLVDTGGAEVIDAPHLRGRRAVSGKQGSIVENLAAPLSLRRFPPSTVDQESRGDQRRVAQSARNNAFARLWPRPGSFMNEGLA